MRSVLTLLLVIFIVSSMCERGDRLPLASTLTKTSYINVIKTCFTDMWFLFIFVYPCLCACAKSVVYKDNAENLFPGRNKDVCACNGNLNEDFSVVFHRLLIKRHELLHIQIQLTHL